MHVCAHSHRSPGQILYVRVRGIQSLIYRDNDNANDSRSRSRTAGAGAGARSSDPDSGLGTSPTVPAIASHNIPPVTTMRRVSPTPVPIPLYVIRVVHALDEHPHQT